MDTSIFSENLKKFRMAKKMTQEEVANILGVNVQTVSRWECATTLPDVLLLPQIAKLYGITVDDFYKKLSVAYDNYAQRLSAVYEKTRDPEDFLRCALEYEKLMKGEELSIADKWNYATIHHFMGRYCKDKALEWYDKAIAEGPEKDPHIYRRARSLRMKLMREIGNIDEVIAEQKKQCELNASNQMEWEFLVCAYLTAGDHDNALVAFQEAIQRFSESWILYIYGGEIYEHRQQYEKAFQCWDKAGEIGTDFHDECYCKASCYETMGEYEKAEKLYLEISDVLLAEGYEEEAEMAKEEAKRLQLKMK